MWLYWDLSTKSSFQQENILSTYLQGLEPKVVYEGNDTSKPQLKEIIKHSLGLAKINQDCQNTFTHVMYTLKTWWYDETKTHKTDIFPGTEPFCKPGDI